jgi:hypothetical protein
MVKEVSHKKSNNPNIGLLLFIFHFLKYIFSKSIWLVSTILLRNKNCAFSWPTQI